MYIQIIYIQFESSLFKDLRGRVIFIFSLYVITRHYRTVLFIPDSNTEVGLTPSSINLHDSVNFQTASLYQILLEKVVREVLWTSRHANALRKCCRLSNSVNSHIWHTTAGCCFFRKFEWFLRFDNIAYIGAQKPRPAGLLDIHSCGSFCHFLLQMNRCSP